MSKKKNLPTRSRKKDSHNTDYELSQRKKANKSHPRSEQSKHKRDFIDWMSYD